jgi:hypothetical protein
MAVLLIAILLGVVLTGPVSAAPGDPRLVQGTLEWPATLTREPVMIVRGDDGQVYFCEITDHARQRVDQLRAGGRISVLGLEAARPHVITTVAVGTGDAAALALALSQAWAKTPSADATASTPPAQTVAPSSPGAPGSTAPAPAAAPAVVVMAPGSHATTPTPAPAPSIVPATVATAAVVAPPASRRIGPPAAATTGGRGQWIRLDGVVESVAGSTLTLKTADGAVAYVDISQLSPSVAQVLRQDTAVSVYGYPLEHRFEAAGYIQTNQTSPGGPEPRVPAQANR